VVGGGYIAVEFAGIFHRFGSEVHLVYRQPMPLRGFDEEVRVTLFQLCKSAGWATCKSGSFKWVMMRAEMCSVGLLLCMVTFCDYDQHNTSQ
jgi:pyruvate/2-oxoglutarate dehydrogenase complex dihydrolipoamide dehydrogenase (E3) component